MTGLNFRKGEGEFFEFFNEHALWWPKGTDYLVVIAMVYELVDCWCDVEKFVRRDRQHAVVFLFRRGDTIFDALVRLRVCDLLLARIRRDDAVEHLRELNRGLAISGCAVPSQCATRRDTGQVFEQLSRVTRPKRRVIGRLL